MYVIYTIKLIFLNVISVFNLNTLMTQTIFESSNNATHEEEGEIGLLYFTSFKAFMALSMNLANHVLIMAVTLPMVYKCYLMDFEKTALHAHLCTIGVC